MPSGSGWNLWVWLTGGGCGWNLWVWVESIGVVVWRYIDILILLIPTPLLLYISALFCSNPTLSALFCSNPTFCSFLNVFRFCLYCSM